MEDSDLEWVQIKPKMTEEQWNVYRRPLSLVFTIGLFVIGLTEAIVLLWHRGTWGFQEWIHEVTFYNFWNGTYIVISASILLMLTCALGYYAIVKRSICWLIAACVLHGATIFLNLVGSIAMFADAFATKEIWLARMIIDMIDPTNYNNNSIKDEFLGNIYRIVECCGADGYKDYTDRFDISPHKECSDHRHSGGIYYEEGCAHKFLVWLKAWAGCALVLCLIVTLVQLQLMFWSKQLLRILKRQQRTAKKSGKTETEQKLLANGVSATHATKGIIKESKSLENFEVPNVPIRSTSQGNTNGSVPTLVQNQVWVPAIQAIPVMFANGQVMMPTPNAPTQIQTQFQNQSQNSVNFQNAGYEKPLPKINDFQRHFRENENRKKSLEFEEQQVTLDLSSETDTKLGKSIENEMVQKSRPQFHSPKSPKRGRNGSENRSGSSQKSQKSHRTESTFAICEDQKPHESSWRITESPNLPPRNSSNPIKNPEINEDFERKQHLYEPINYDMAAKSRQKSPAEIKQLYREIRPGRLSEEKSQNSTSSHSGTSKNSKIGPLEQSAKSSSLSQFDKSQKANAKSHDIPSSDSSKSLSSTQSSQFNIAKSRNSRFDQSQFSSQSPTSTPNSQNSRLEKSQNSRNEISSNTTSLKISQNPEREKSQFTTKSPSLASKSSKNPTQNVRFESSHLTRFEKSQNSRFQSPENSNGSTGYPHSTTESPTIPQPGIRNSGKNSGYVNIPMPFHEQKSTLDRTREWVTSQESLIPKPLPPKPNLPMVPPSSGIPYGYENVLPISQRFRDQPYGILSNMTDTNETCTTLTSDDESEYLTRGDLTRNLKLAIRERTVVEGNEDQVPNSYRKKLAAETSI